MLPVPLNSSKITSSIREPVSMSAVAMMVSEPPPSMFRAAPKNRLGFWSALASTPPERIFPECGTTTLWARASRVMESSRMTTSRPCSTSRLDGPVGRLSEGGGDDLGLDVFLHVGDLLGPLVDEQHDQDHFGMVLRDGVGHLLHQDGLPGLGRRHDQPALALADRREEIHHPHREVAVLPPQAEARRRVRRPEVVEGDPVLGLLRSEEHT